MKGLKQSGFPGKFLGVKPFVGWVKRSETHHKAKRKYLISGVLTLLLVAALLPLASSSSPAAGGEVGGLITEDTTWTLAGSPYIVTANVTVLPNVTLAVEAGVTIKFDGNFQVRIAGGAFNVNGTGDSPVIFTSNQSNPAVGDWNTILFDSDSTGTIANAIIEYAPPMILHQLF